MGGRGDHGAPSRSAADARSVMRGAARPIRRAPMEPPVPVKAMSGALEIVEGVAAMEPPHSGKRPSLAQSVCAPPVTHARRMARPHATESTATGSALSVGASKRARTPYQLFVASIHG